MNTLVLALGLSRLGLLFFAALAVRALRHFPRSRLEELAQRSSQADRLGEILRFHERTAVAAETMQTLALAVVLVCGGYWLWREGHDADRGAWVYAIAAGALLLAVNVWVPSAAASVWGEGFLLRTWPVWKLVRRGMWPLVGLARVVEVLVHRIAGHVEEESTEESFDEEIRTVVTEGHREGLLEANERQIIEKVIDLGDVVISQIMTPRTDISCLSSETPLEEVMAYAAKDGHTRIPIYGKNRDDMVGILYIKDLLAEVLKPVGGRRTLQDLVRQPHFVPESKPVLALLQEFREQQNHLALVLDEYGGVSGLVTIEDVLEEIVGEIEDEYDEVEDEGIELVGEAACDAQARVHIDLINQRLGLSLEDEGDFDTIGGLVFSRLGRVPVPGEQVLVDNARITVLAATPRRVERVRIERLDAAGQPAT